MRVRMVAVNIFAGVVMLASSAALSGQASRTEPSTRDVCFVAAENVVVSTVKKAENGSSVIVRLYEIDGSPAESAIEFLGQRRRFHEVNLLEEEMALKDEQVLRVKPHEIKTLKFQ